MTIKDFEHVKYADGYRITGYEGECENIIIPEGVTVIATYAFRRSKIRSVILPSSLKYVHDSAFEECGRLTSVDFSKAKGLEVIGANAFSSTGLLEAVLPDSVLEIGYGAFSICRSLMRIYIPSTVASMDWDIFAGCSSLKAITVGGKIPSSWGDRWNGSEAKIQTGKAFALDSSKSVSSAPKVAVPEVKRVVPEDKMSRQEPKMAVKSEPKKTAPVTPSAPFVKNEYYTPMSELNVKRTADGLMLVDVKNRGLRELILPPEITAIADNATVFSKDIEKFKAGPTLKSIGYRAFSDCTGLKEIEFPFSVSIGEQAFDDCVSLERAILTRNMGKEVYNRSGVRSFDCAVGELCPTVIPEGTFMHTEFSEFRVPEGVTHISKQAFAYCTKLENIHFGKGKVDFGEEVFFCCYCLKSFEFTSNMPSDIPKGMFFHCVGLENIKFSHRPGKIGSSSLVGIGMREIRIPGHMTPDIRSVGAKKLEKIILEGRTLADLERMGYNFIANVSGMPWKSVRIVCEDGIKFYGFG